MALEKITSGTQERAAEFRKRKKTHDEQLVTSGALKDFEPLGWVKVKELKTGIRIRKERSEAEALENRFWCCLYRLGFPDLNIGRQFRIPIGDSTSKQVDVFAKDDETVVIAECKTAEEHGKKSIQKDLGEFQANKKAISDAVRKHYGKDFKPKIIWLFVTQNIVITDSDRDRAKAHQISLISDRELTYFEEIAKALGSAARQQFKAEYLAGLAIPALENKKLPAVKTRVGGHVAFVFSSKPSDILRVAFVNHRDLRDPNSAPTYQRLVNPNRLTKICSFLEQGGYFPNSIILNFQKKPRFELAAKSDDKDIQFGYLYLPDKYKSLKVIDGQHRLFGCALLEDEAKQPNLFFLAFEGITGGEEANLFATINKEQQKVPKRLLDELDGELRWDSEVIAEKIQAICSRSIDLLNAKYGSPFEDTIVSPGLNASDDRPLTLPEIRKAIISSGLLGRAGKSGNWAVGSFCSSKNGKIDNESTLERLMAGLTTYFSKIKAANVERWELGKEGRVCNNFGVPGHIRLLGELIRHSERSTNLESSELSLKQIYADIDHLIVPIIDFIKNTNDEDFGKKFNVSFGSGGIKQYYFALSQIVNAAFPEFRPSGFEQWLSEISKEEQDQADKDAKRIQDRVHGFVVQKLRSIYGETFFDDAITNREMHNSAHKKRIEDSAESRGGPEKYLDFLDLKKIIEQKEHWPEFESAFNIRLPSQKNGMAKYIQWFDEVNRIRRVSAHPYQRTYSQADLDVLKIVRSHLNEKLSSNAVGKLEVSL